MQNLERLIGELTAKIATIDNREENNTALIQQIHLAVHNMQAAVENLANSQAEIEAGKSVSGNFTRMAALESAALSKVPEHDFSIPAPKIRKQSTDFRELLKSHNSDLYPLWQKLYDASLPHYEESIEASCSTWENRYAVAFRDYVHLFARGHLLDIGCGNLTRPVYLEGYPALLLSGLDPREATSDTDFVILQGVNEYLPWEDASFQTVCNATSLDHVLDLPRSLDETARILVPKGKFILWYANIAGAPLPPEKAMDPLGKNSTNIDEFHLFHINDDWFLPIMNKYFELIDRRIFPSGGFDHVFAVYERR